MKFLMSLALVLAAGAAFASPAVGDKSLFNVTIEQNGAQILGSYEIALTSKDASGNFVMKTIINLEDQQPVVQEQSVEPQGLISDAQVSQVLANCAAFGGKPGAYTVTQAASTLTLPTCVLPTQDQDGSINGEVSVAQVPFGIAKQIQLDSSTGRTLTLSLQAFTAGK